MIRAQGEHTSVYFFYPDPDSLPRAPIKSLGRPFQNLADAMAKLGLDRGAPIRSFTESTSLKQ